ncbi:MAG: hypothetical protein ABI276_04205 [Acidimicrobiales bacterium]
MLLWFVPVVVVALGVLTARWTGTVLSRHFDEVPAATDGLRRHRTGAVEVRRDLEATAERLHTRK